MKLIRLAALAAAVTLISAGTFAAENKKGTTWNMPTPYGEKNFHTVNIKQFAEDVARRTNNKLRIKVHSGGSLFKHPEIKNAVRGGQVPIGEFFLSRLSNENAVFGVDSVPFLATDYKSAHRLWEASKKAIEKLLKKQGLRVLFAVPWPPQGVYAKKELNSVADMKGLKFRAYNAATEQLAKLAGAVPTQIEVPDLPQAFATGRVQAMITSPSTGANSKAWDYVPYFYHVQAWLPKNITVVNEKAFDALDKSTQSSVLAAAAAAEKRGWEASKKETGSKIAILKKNGMKVSAPSAALKSGLQKIGRIMTADWVKKAGAEGKAVLKAYGR